MNKIKNLFYIFLPIILGGLSSILTGNMNNSYLYKPPLTPPSLLFPIVWSILYLLSGVSFYLYKKDLYKDKNIELSYYINLFLNFLWPILFFKFKLRFLAIIDVLGILISLIILLKNYYNNYKLPFKLNIPYLLWSTFASYLTIGFYILNI